MPQNKLCNPMHRTADRRDNLIIWLLMSIVFTALVINQSLRQGQLALPPTYDDIVYFTDALTRLNILYDHGAKALAENFIESPPHAPLATLVPLIGFSIFGVHNWAPPIVNGIFVLFLLVLVDSLAQGVSRAGKILIGMIALSWPVTGQLVIECRPDLAWGLITATFTILSLREQSRVTRSKKSSLIIGLLIGLSLLAKPSIFPITLIAALASLFVAFLFDIRRQDFKLSRRSALASNIRCLVVALTIAMPYYVAAHKQVYAYIYEVVFSSNASMWDPNAELTLFDHLSYYLTSASGQIAMGKWIYAWFLFVVVCTAALLSKKDWKRLTSSLPLWLGFFILYLLVTAPKLKMNFFGASLYFYILCTFVILVAEVSRALRSSRYGSNFSYAFIIVIFLFGVGQFQWPWYHISKQTGVLSSEVQYRRSAIESLYNDILENQKENRIRNEKPISVFFTTSNKFFNSFTLKFQFAKDNVLNNTRDLYLSDNLPLFVQSINSSDYVVAFNASNTDTFPWLPSSKIQGQVLSLLRSDPSLQLIRTYADPYGDNQAYLFGRVHSGSK
ncbi:hypothetical protein [Cyanobium gracile]|uniref:Glycosyltransferase RgtA/B/C/D-like domain-containing protein n=1 Tax=Cyanobium gracile UHCC 0281 TaxID=3110309 RepID=A0ABU5SU65_9CYAN|nr:hypothetical protein [Cyanobium gracile]MEA5442033.1 hypothetical protein [Cyanobium gracile UHCC 0281]